MTKRDTAIRRVQKLKALADSEKNNGNEQAAETAARIAQKLMMEHAIASLELDASVEEEMGTANVDIGRRLNWLRTLYYHVAEANNCTLSYKPRSSIVTFYGTPSDIEVAEYLAIHLSREVQAAADKYIKSYRDAWGYVPSTRNDFCQSAVHTLGLRLKVMRREVAQEARDGGESAQTVSHALIRIEQGLQRAKDFAASHGLRRGQAARWSLSREGIEAGRSININKGVSGSSARGALEG